MFMPSWLSSSKAYQPPGTPSQITMLEEEKIPAYFGAGLLYAAPERQEPLF